MKTIYFIIVSLLLTLSLMNIANAATVEIEYKIDHLPPNIEGVKLYERVGDAKIEILNITDMTSTRAEFELPGEVTECRTFFMTAYIGNVDGMHGNTAALCPEYNLPDMIVAPGGTVNFSIKILE